MAKLFLLLSFIAALFGIIHFYQLRLITITCNWIFAPAFESLLIKYRFIFYLFKILRNEKKRAKLYVIRVDRFAGANEMNTHKHGQQKQKVSNLLFLVLFVFTIEQLAYNCSIRSQSLNWCKSLKIRFSKRNENRRVFFSFFLSFAAHSM